jgi:hypothetical protein
MRSNVGARLLAVGFVALLVLVQTAQAGSWNNIEPLKSRRADVERVLGKPIEEKGGESGALRFKVAGGTVMIAFVSAKFVATKKLAPELEGTVLQIVLQHEGAKDTPESLGLVNNSNFQREDKDGVSHFRNQKDGISYTFINGKLKTTWHSPAAEELARTRTKG